MLCHVCYGLLPTFPLLSSDDDDKGEERERERTLNVNLTNKWSGRHEKTFVADADSSRKVYSVSQTHEVVDNNHSVGWPQFAKSHECPLRRVNERVDKEC